MTTPGEIADPDRRERKLGESPHPIVVSRRDGTNDELAAMGTRYWDLLGLADDGRLIWAVRAREIGPDPGSQPHVTALAGVTVHVPEVACLACNVTPWQPISRTAFEVLVRTGVPSRGCVSCDPIVRRTIANLLDPSQAEHRAAEAARRAQREQERQRQRLDEAGSAKVRQRWEELRRAAIEDYAPLTLTSMPDWALVQSTVATEAAALACIRHAPATNPIPPVKAWSTPLTPDINWTNESAGDFWRAGLLSVHPRSAAATFALKLSLDEAMETGDHSSWERLAETLPTPVIAGIYATSVSWYSPHGPTMQTAAQWLDRHLVERLDPALMDAGRQEELLDLVSKLIAAETIRYLEFELDKLNLPKVSDNHRPRLVQAAAKLSQHRSLGESYHLAWLSAQKAASAAQANLRAPRENMTTHAVNQFEQRAHEAIAAPAMELKSWRENPNLPLSGLTKVVFYGLLDTLPMQTRLPAIVQALPDPVPDWPVLPGEQLDADVEVTRADPQDEPLAVETATGAGDEPPITAAVRELLENMALIDPEAAMAAFREKGRSESEGAEEPHSGVSSAVDAMVKACGVVVEAGGDQFLGLVAACAAAVAFPEAYTEAEGLATTVGEHLAGVLVACAFESRPDIAR